MTGTITDVSRNFFFEIVKPVLEHEFPREMEQTAFGVFGYGSEVLKLDDEYSSDHHWGLRINALVPDYLMPIRKDLMLQAVADNLPDTFQGHSLREGYTGIASLEIDSLEGLDSEYIFRYAQVLKQNEKYTQSDQWNQYYCIIYTCTDFIDIKLLS